MIDLDILFYKDLVINTENLIIPHPEITNRPFIKYLLTSMKLQNNFSLPQNLENLFNLNFLDFKDFFIKTLVLKPRIIGILNITKDSFSDGGKFYDIDRAIEQMLNLHNDGASIIEIGAQSTRPNSLMHSIENEYSKLNEFFTKAKNIIIEKKFKLV